MQKIKLTIKKKTLILTALATFLAIGLFAYFFNSSITIETLFIVPSDDSYTVLSTTTQFSKDGKHFVHDMHGKRLEDSARSHRIIWDGEERRYEGDAELALISMSSNGKSLIYSEGEDENGESKIIFDDKKFNVRSIRDFGFSPNSDHYSYVVFDIDGKTSMVMDEKKTPLPDVFELIFSDDRAHYAYIYSVKGGGERVIYNGVEGDVYDDIDNLLLSRDGKHFAYTAKIHGKGMLVRDGVEGAPFDEVAGATFTADGNHIFYIAKAGSRFGVVKDEEMEGTFPFIGMISVNHDGSLYAYIANNDPFGTDKDILIINGEMMKTRYHNISFLTVSLKGKHYAYQGDQMVVHDNTELGEFNEVSDITLSNDGKHIAFQAVQDGQDDSDATHFVVRDGKIGRTYRGQLYISDIQWSDSGRHLMYMVQGFTLTESDADEQKEGLVIDGVEHPHYDIIRNAHFEEAFLKERVIYNPENDEKILRVENVLSF